MYLRVILFIELFTGLMTYNLMCLFCWILLRTVQIVFNTQLTVCTVSLDLLLCFDDDFFFLFFLLYIIHCTCSIIVFLLLNFHYYFLVFDCCSVFVWYERFNFWYETPTHHLLRQPLKQQHNPLEKPIKHNHQYYNYHSL